MLEVAAGLQVLVGLFVQHVPVNANREDFWIQLLVFKFVPMLPFADL